MRKFVESSVVLRLLHAARPSFRPALDSVILFIIAFSEGSAKTCVSCIFSSDVAAGQARTTFQVRDEIVKLPAQG
jgi:hypothetical protein